MKGIVIISQPKYQAIWNNIVKLTRPGWGFLNLSQLKEAVVIPSDYMSYVSAVIYNPEVIESLPDTKSTMMTGVCLQASDRQPNEFLKKHQARVQAVYIPTRVKQADNDIEIERSLNLGEYAQSLGIIPIFAFHFLQLVNIATVQQVYSQFVAQLHNKKIFPQGCIIETALLDLEDKQKALMNLTILRRTIPSVINSIVLRFDSKTQKRKDVFDMTFVKIKLPWLFAFSFQQLVGYEEIEKAAFECSAIE